ncbi:MAG: hypothetical protein K0U54_01720 [Bacteroidetes bacterium]|nr:hypothetical protein [Bacteroidota bacterium]
MKIEHLEERIIDYRNSIETVVDKKTLWSELTRLTLLKTLHEIVKTYPIGWKVQELNWIHNNAAINITFDSFPPELIDCTNKVPEYQFIPGGTLVFSQSYSGDVLVFILFPTMETGINDNGSVDLGLYAPNEITEKMIVEQVDQFLKEMIKWEVPNIRKKVGYS